MMLSAALRSMFQGLTRVEADMADRCFIKVVGYSGTRRSLFHQHDVNAPRVSVVLT